MGASLYIVCVPGGSSERAGFDMSSRHAFSQCFLASITWVGGGARGGGTRFGARLEAGLPPCPVAIIALSGAMLSLKLLEQTP